ncbi:MAG: hypothetical protein M1818_005902 [Claussenomyces sp. TS43310]|nr:MAG: hypothetical protein M1818_005902 [Claussenomyces sp. TS43310]
MDVIDHQPATSAPWTLLSTTPSNEPACPDQTYLPKMTSDAHRQRSAQQSAQPQLKSNVAALSAGAINTPSKRQRRSASTATPANKKRPKKDPWASNSVLQDPKSPLISVDLKALLADPEAWNTLTPDERAEILALMPPQGASQGGEEDKSINGEFLKYDQDWSHSVSNYKQDLAEGRNDPEWQAQAIAASQKRRAGQFDAFKEQEFEEFWGQKHKPPPGVTAGTSSKVKFSELFLANALQLGDIFFYSKQFKAGVEIKKEAKVIAITSGYADFSFAPDDDDTWSDRPDNIVVTGLCGPELLIKAMIRSHGQGDLSTTGNGWKSVRVFRDQQDLGNLWDIRQAFSFARCEGDYRASLTGYSIRSRRASDELRKAGYCWINQIYLVKKTLLSDIEHIPQSNLVPVTPELGAALTSLAPSGYTFVLCDMRIVKEGGYFTPDGVSVEEIEAKGPEAFRTAWTRTVAGTYGPSWSGGHAHVGIEQLGTPNMNPHKKLELTVEEKNNLSRLLCSRRNKNLPEACVRVHHQRPKFVPSTNASAQIEKTGKPDWRHGVGIPFEKDSSSDDQVLSSSPGKSNAASTSDYASPYPLNAEASVGADQQPRAETPIHMTNHSRGFLNNNQPASDDAFPLGHVINDPMRGFLSDNILVGPPNMHSFQNPSEGYSDQSGIDFVNPQYAHGLQESSSGGPQYDPGYVQSLAFGSQSADPQRHNMYLANALVAIYPRDSFNYYSVPIDPALLRDSSLAGAECAAKDSQFGRDPNIDPRLQSSGPEVLQDDSCSLYPALDTMGAPKIDYDSPELLRFS